MMQILVLGFLILNTFAYGKMFGVNNEERLFRDLINNYDPLLRDVRPVQNHLDTQRVQYGLALIHINAFNVQTGDGEFLFWERHSWNDTRLVWNPELYGNIDHIRIPTRYIWTPDILQYNSLHKENEHKTETMAVVSSEGNILYISPHIRQTVCNVTDAGKEEKREFHCSFKVGSWTYDGYMLDINFYDGYNDVDMNDYIPHHKVKVQRHEAVKNVTYYPCCEEPYPDLTFKVVLKVT